MPPFGGPIPATMMAAPSGAGPAVAPHGNPGNTSQGLSDVRLALEALQKALPSVPMGTELHKAVLDAIKKIGTHMTEMQDSPQMKMQNLMQMMQRARQAQPNQALAGLTGGPQPSAGQTPQALQPPSSQPPALAA